MAEEKHRPAYHVIDGLRVPLMFPEENVRSAIRYKPRPDDIILVTYPKCGTTWSQHMLSLILMKGVPETSVMGSFVIAPFLEAMGASAALEMPRPGIIKAHLPFHLTPYSPEAKYIYVSRNPKDCCVSYFYHMKNMGLDEYEASFDEFFEHFISGETYYGDYFDHLLEWYKHKNDSNVLFVTYEEMKTDAKAAALKFASFLGKEHADLLKDNPKVLEDVIKYSSFSFMKEMVNDSFSKIFEMDQETIRNDPNVPEGMKKFFLSVNAGRKPMKEKNPTTIFIRKGIIGDWRNHFSPEQNKRMDEKISQKLNGTELMDLWKEYMQLK